jgi:hypothetical protein
VAAVLAQWFHVQDGMAFRRVADAVTAALRPRAVDERVCERFLYLASHLEEGGVKRVARHARLALGLPPDWSFRQMRAVPSDAWQTGDKAFAADEVCSLVARMARVFEEQGWPVRPVSVTPARESGDYLRDDYRGHSVTLACS